MNDNLENDRPATNDFGTAGGSGATGQGGMVTALFKTRAGAETAYDALKSHGYTEQDINVMMSEEGRSTHFGDGTADTELGSKAAEGTGVGSAIGGTVGAIVAAVAAIGTSIALPGLGLVIAGPIAAALMGAGAGGVTGGLLGALIGSGIPEEHAAQYEAGIKEGGIVLGVKPHSADDAALIETAFRSAHGESVYR